MKKLLLSIAVLTTTTLSFSQRDLEIELVSPASGATVAIGQVSFSFNVKNNGPDAINPGDTLYLGYLVNTTFYSLDGVVNTASGLVIPDGFTIPAGQSIPFAAFSSEPITHDLTGIPTDSTVCPTVVGIGEASLGGQDPNDPDMTNNFDCFIVSPNASIGEISTLGLNVYPNPAADVLNIKMNEEVASVVITALDGKTVATETSASVTISGLNSGMYLYTITSVSGKVAKGNFVKN